MFRVKFTELSQAPTDGKKIIATKKSIKWLSRHADAKMYGSEITWSKNQSIASAFKTQQEAQNAIELAKSLFKSLDNFKIIEVK